MTYSHIFSADAYKWSHFYQDPANTTFKQSHVVARGVDSSIAEFCDDGVVFFGMHAFVERALLKKVNLFEVAMARDFAQQRGMPFNEQWFDIVNKHKGRLPLKIDSLKEGTVVPFGVAQVTVTNTDPQFPWLTSYIETALLRAIWYPSTVATISRAVRKMVYANLVKTSDDPDGQIDFKLHDFGQRGVSSHESAELGGMAHLINFNGTDTVEGVRAAEQLYNVDCGPIGFGVPAMEHSTVTIWGRDGEEDAYRNMLAKSNSPIVSFVSDSYDIYNACEHIWGEKLHDEVVASGKTVVIRPDSGDPVSVVMAVLEILGSKFGFDVNSKGYKVLKYVRVLQGDGINLKSIQQILGAMSNAGWSGDNIVFGMGGALLQGVTRDTFKYAMKCNAGYVDGKVVNVYKDPITDPGKSSAKGPLTVSNKNGVLENVLDEYWPEVRWIDRNAMQAAYLSIGPSTDVEERPRWSEIRSLARK